MDPQIICDDLYKNRSGGQGDQAGRQSGRADSRVGGEASKAQRGTKKTEHKTDAHILIMMSAYYASICIYAKVQKRLLLLCASNK